MPGQIGSLGSPIIIPAERVEEVAHIEDSIRYVMREDVSGRRLFRFSSSVPLAFPIQPIEYSQWPSVEARRFTEIQAAEDNARSAGSRVEVATNRSWCFW